MFAPGRLSCAGTENTEWSTGQEVEARELRGRDPKYVNVVIEVFWCSVFAVSLMLASSWEVCSWPRFSHCCLAPHLPCSLFPVTGDVDLV